MITDKYRYVADQVKDGIGTLLDVGCRDAILSTYIAPSIQYTGVDLMPGPKVTRVCNIEEGLPFDDATFDAVAALDLLEHTDDIWHSFDELVRVARTKVFVVLPNLFWWRHRIAHMFGRETDKYRLTAERIEDRHRWLTSYRSAHDFAEGMARRRNLRVSETLVAGGRRTVVIDSALSLVSKNLGSWAVMHVFEKGNQR
jgi:hypothetical protein